AELEPLGLGGEPQAKLDEIGEDLVALALEMVLGGPQRLEAELIHHAGDVARGEERFAQALVRVEAVIRRVAVAADVGELDLADVEDVEFLDHVTPAAEADCPSACRIRVRDLASARKEAPPATRRRRSEDEKPAGVRPPPARSAAGTSRRCR